MADGAFDADRAGRQERPSPGLERRSWATAGQRWRARRAAHEPPPRRLVMSVVLSTERLRLELARRGWGTADLARAARVSAPMIGAAVAGRPVAPGTLRRIATALAEPRQSPRLMTSCLISARVHSPASKAPPRLGSRCA